MGDKWNGPTACSLQDGQKKRLPIGVEDFADFRRMNYYYVDKTRFIKEFLDNPGKVNTGRTAPVHNKKNRSRSS